MLKLRIITALVLGPFILWSVLAFSHRAIAIELAIILLLGAWEWARMAGITNSYARIFYALILGLLMTVGSSLLHVFPENLTIVLYVATGWWIFCLLWLVRAEQKGIEVKSVFPGYVVVINLGIGIVVLLGAFVAITGLHQAQEYGPYYIISLLVLIWVADSAAYFTGKAIGKHKLSPNVSPGKTWEGVLGAMVATVIASYVLAILLKLDSTKIFPFIALGIVSIVFSVIGDLFESMFKRKAGIKDSSHILPGHGGILDRIDSLVAAAPLFYLGLILAGIK